MKPSQLAAKLNHIATAITNSKQPSRALVAQELKKVLASFSRTSGAKKPYLFFDYDETRVVVMLDDTEVQEARKQLDSVYPEGFELSEVPIITLERLLEKD